VNTALDGVAGRGADLAAGRPVLAAADDYTNTVVAVRNEGSGEMAKLVVSEEVSLDGVVQDPTGEEGFRHGGWFNRVGEDTRRAWAEAKTQEAFATTALLHGRKTDEWFGERWCCERRFDGRQVLRLCAGILTPLLQDYTVLKEVAPLKVPRLPGDR